MLLCFYGLIATRRLWVRPRTLPFLVIGSIFVLPDAIGGGSMLDNLVRFLTSDIVPAPLRRADLAGAGNLGARRLLGGGYRCPPDHSRHCFRR